MRTAPAPDAPIRDDGSRVGRWERAGAVGVFVLAVVLAWSRMPAAVRDVLWAEDGRTFLGEGVQYGTLGTLTRSYAGYLHQYPRLVAGVVQHVLPVEGWATGIAFGAVVGTGLVAAVVFVCTRDATARLTPGAALAARAGIALAVVLVPIATNEVLGNLANVHAYFLWMMPFVLLHRPRSWASSVGLAVVTLLGALTETQAIVFAPLLVLGLRARRTWPVRAAFLAGAGLQLAVWLGSDRHRGQVGRATIDLASLADGFGLNAGMTTFLSRAASGEVLAAVGSWAGLLFLVPFVVAFVWVLVRGDRTQRTLAVVLALYAVVLWCAAVVLNPKPAYAYAGMSPEFLRYAWVSRYGVFPATAGLVLVLLALVTPRRWSRTRSAVGVAAPASADPSRRSLRPRRVPRRPALGTAVRSTVAVVLLVLMVVQFRPLGPVLRTDGPRYTAAVAAAREACRTLPADRAIRIRSAPQTQQDTPGPPTRQEPTSFWSLSMSCAVVTGARTSDVGHEVEQVRPVPTFG